MRAGAFAAQPALLGLGLAAACAPAVAQQQQPGPEVQQVQQLQEVIVTAQKRAQDVQNVPIAITPFTSQTLQEQHITSLAQLGNLTPGVTLTAGSPFSGDRSVLSASIRGIGQDDFAFNTNPAVGVYVDGVYYARTIGANVNLLDVQNVSILKGPQGTLFGANTIGGAISVTTRTPGNTPSFVAEATGGSFNRRDIAFSADIPIIKDKLLSSITVSSQNQDGFQRVIPYPTSSPDGSGPFVVTPQNAWPASAYQTSDSYGGTGVFAMRGKLLWLASDNLKVTLEGDWTHENQTALPNVILGTVAGSLASQASTFSTLYNLCLSNDATTLPGAIQAAGGPPTFVAANGLFAGLCSQPRGRVPGLAIGGSPLLGAGYVGGPAGPYNYSNHPGTAYLGSPYPRIYDDFGAANTGSYDTTYATGPDFARNDVFGFALTGEYRLSDSLQLKSITGYRQIQWRIGTDLDGTPETLLQVTDAQHQYQVSEEVQLLGKALDDRLNWVTGLYYFHEAGYVHDFVPFEGILDVYDGTGNDVDNKDYAAYFHADYSFDSRWTLTVGGRYTDAQAYFIGSQGDLNSFPFGSYCWLNSCGGAPAYTDIIPNAWAPGNPYFRYFPGTPDSQAWHIFDPTGSIQYHFTPSTMGYVTWSKGFMAGGWTTRLSLNPISDPADARYGPETSKAWDAGVKTELFDRHLIVDGDVYYTDFNGIQLNVQNGISPVLTNAGNAKIKGAELSFQSLIADTGLQLNGSASYIDAYYTSVNPEVGLPQYADSEGNTYCPAGPPACTFTWTGVSPLSAQLPKTPKWKIILDPQYRLSLPSGASLAFVPVYTYTSEMFNDAVNTPQLRRPVTHILDASLHYLSASGTYELAVGGTNLTNQRYITGGQANYGAGEIDGYVNAPREWYATLRVQFGH